MKTKSAPQPFNKADARIDIPSSQIAGRSLDAEDVLPLNVPILDTDWDEISEPNSAENNPYEA
jgi:hypothetical protein